MMEIGKIWPGWELAENIGEGSFGKVYRITRQDFGHLYESALKVITIPSSRGELVSVLNDGFDEESVTVYFRSMVEDIVDEFALMSRLRGNSNIVSYEDHAVIPHEGEIGWDIYIRMELLTPLFRHIRQHPLSMQDVITLGIHICRALEVCQNYNIIHRDIKPENIFISDLGQYKLGDFGIARQLEKTSAGLSKKGTYSYMAPEVSKGEKYNSTVDIYSLGIVLYRFLNNNRNPFFPPYPKQILPSDHEKANALRIKGTKMQPPCNADGRLAEVVLKACAFDPKERYQNARDMREALEEVLHSEKGIKMVMPNEDRLEADESDDLYASAGAEESGEGIAMLSMDDLEPDENPSVPSGIPMENAEKTVNLFGEKMEEKIRQIEEEEAKRKAEKEQKKVEEEAREKAKEEERRQAEAAQKKAEEERRQAEEEQKKAEEAARKKAEEEKKRREEEKKRKEEEKKRKEAEARKRKEEAAQKKAEETRKRKEEAAQKKAEEEQKRNEKKAGQQKNNKVVLIAAGCAAAVGIGILSFFMLQKGSQTTVPNFMHMEFSEAEALALENGLTLQKSEERYSDTAEKGTVLSQDFEAGVSIKKDSTVTVVLSKGKQVKVPNVVRLTEAEAKKKLADAGLSVKLGEAVYSDTIEAGTVVSQSLTEGEAVDENAVVTVILSKGSEQTSVPKVTGLSRKEAKAALAEANLKMTIEEAYSSEAEKGIVISQSVEQGTQVPPQTEVHLVISKGPEPVEEDPEPAKKTTTKQQNSNPQPQNPQPTPQPDPQPQNPQPTPQQAPPSTGNEESIDNWDLIN